MRTAGQPVGLASGAAVESGTRAGVVQATLPETGRGERKSAAKRSWFGSLWALILGKPAKTVQGKPKPVRAETGKETAGSTEEASAAPDTGGAPEAAKKAKAVKQGFFAGVWSGIVRRVTFVVGLVVLGVMWGVQKVREGFEWIRVRLNLD